jgi:hypothetical protein
MVGGLGLAAFATMHVTYLLGYDSPFMPGAISLVFMALWILLLRRYGPQGPVDPRRHQVWFLSSLALCGALAALGMIAALWMGAIYAAPSAPCPAPCHQPS